VYRCSRSGANEARWRAGPRGQETRTAAADLPEGLQDRGKAVWLGEVEAPDEAAAMEKAAAEFNVPAPRVMAIRG
jgi:hypothetical protein